MKPRMSINSIVDTDAHADTLISSIENKLSGKSVFESYSLLKSLNENDKTQISLEIRFNNSVDRDAVKDWVKDQLQNHPQVKTWVSNAKVVWHNCTNDESSPIPCGQSQYFEWSQ